MAPADQGFRKSDGFVATTESPFVAGTSSCGERMGDEKESKYRAMKKSSFRKQNVNSTFCKGVLAAGTERKRCMQPETKSWTPAKEQC